MQALELFRVAAKLVVDKGDFDKDMQEADKGGKSFAENLSGYMEKAKNVITGIMGALAIKEVVSGIWNLAKETAAAGDRIDKTSQALGLSRKAFQEWDYILAQNGASIDSLGASMRTLQAAISANSGETAAALSQLGLSAAHLQSISPEEQFEEIVRALQKLPDGAKKSQIAMQLLGRNAQSLMPLLNQSAESTEELRNRAHDLGLVMSDDDVDASVAFGDALDDLTRTFNAFKQRIGAQLLPTLTKGISGLTDFVAKIRKAYDAKGIVGVFESLITDFKNIKWPTWEDVRNAIINGWNSIIKGVESLGKVIFGENVDGTVKWPTWEDIGNAIVTAWNAIIKGVEDLGKIIFGENVDGTIDWPTWEEIGDAITTAWTNIVNGVSTLGETVGKAIFGENVDGTVKWPTWAEIGSAIATAWEEIVKGVSNLGETVGKAIFGENVDGTIKWPTWAEVGQAARTAATSIITGLSNLFTELGAFIFGKQDDSAATKWPTWNDVEAIAKSAWEGIQKGLEGLGELLGAFIFGTRDDGSINWPTWSDVETAARDAWSGIVEGLKGFVNSIGSFVFGDLNKDALKWPTWDTVKQAAEDAWRGIKNGLANLVVTVGKFVFGEKDENSLNWIETIKGWFDSTGLGVTVNFITGAVGDMFNKVKNWISGIGNSAKINFGLGTVASMFNAVKGWIDNTFIGKGNSFSLDFGEGTIGAWFDTVKSWIESSGLKTIVNFWSGTIGQWLQTVLDWVRNGVTIGVNFLSNPTPALGSAGDVINRAITDPDSSVPTPETRKLLFDSLFGGSFAKGLNYVPYDGYAFVHRGETILNQDKGRAYRENNGFNPQELYSAVASAVEAAVSNIQINMDGKQVGNAVTDQVSRNIYRAQYGRRFTYA